MNEYHEKFVELEKQHSFKNQQWFGKRKGLVEKYGWAIPTDEVLTYIAGFDDEVIEVGAGMGYWASLLRERGLQIRPIDIRVPDETWTEIEEENAFRLSDIRDSIVLLIWPPYSNNGHLAESVAQKKPSHILYVGEEQGGCTASHAFFDILTSQYGLVGKIDLPSYAGVDDNFYHYVRKR